ncbi:glycosyltransferase [Pseudoalteromonas sp. AS84]|uniref:glycosyltransferase n=1 Tax=Pseudoalteromonas sp. AS84 TaxID=3135778 RepID=UPI003175C126
MNIVFYLENLKDGGVQRRTMRLLQGVVDEKSLENASVHLIINEPNGENINLVPDSVKLYVLGALKGTELKKQLRKTLKNIVPDIVTCCMGQQFMEVIRFKKQLPTACRWYVIQAVPVELLANSWIKNFVRKVAIKHYYPMADKVICVSDEVKATVDGLSTKLKSKTLTIYNPVVSNRLIELAEEPLQHTFFNIENTVLVAAGRLNVQKDYHTLINAFEIAFKNNQNLRLIILGGGDLLDELQNEVNNIALAEYIDLVGFVDNPYKYVSRADLFVMSSLWEGLPNAMIEAMALGKQVVSTDCIAGPREILEDEKFGTLVPIKNTAAFAEGIKKELSTQRNIQLIKNRGWQFSVSNAAKNYIKLFNTGTL